MFFPYKHWRLCIYKMWLTLLWLCFYLSFPVSILTNENLRPRAQSLGGWVRRRHREELRRRWSGEENGDVNDGECTHNHGGDRFRCVVFGLGNSTTWLGGRNRNFDNICYHQLLHIHYARRLLSIAGHGPRNTELYLHGRGPILPWYALWKIVLNFISRLK